MFFNTGVEYNCIYKIRDKIKSLLKDTNIRFTELYPSTPFLDKMLKYEFQKRDGSIQQGYKWCGGRCRWGTTEKNKTLKKYQQSKDKDYIDYVGIAVDELNRIKENPHKCYPLVEANMTEKDCLQYCYSHGFNWNENGYNLYDYLDRVSCWCCRNKNLKELQFIEKCLPEYWNRLKELQSKMSDFPYYDKSNGKAMSIEQLEKRFRLEEQFLKDGKSIRSRNFYKTWDRIRNTI